MVNICASFLAPEADQQNVLISIEELIVLRSKANSRRKFALKQAEKMFTQDERIRCKCHGKHGKEALDKCHLNQIFDNTFRLWPLEPNKTKQNCGKNAAMQSMKMEGCWTTKQEQDKLRKHSMKFSLPTYTNQLHVCLGTFFYCTAKIVSHECDWEVQSKFIVITP